MPKFKYIATFADGSVSTRASEHNYTVAWKATYRRCEWSRVAPYQLVNISDDICVMTGFSKDAGSVSPVRPVLPIPRHLSANEKALRRKKNAEHLQAIGYNLEIVPAVKS